MRFDKTHFAENVKTQFEKAKNSMEKLKNSCMWQILLFTLQILFKSLRGIAWIDALK